MSLYIDKKYINLISPLLPKFKWKKENLANCRCVICGDSTSSKGKARGYFFVKNNNLFYKCHNCSVGYNVYNFLQIVSPSLCKEYLKERYCTRETITSYEASYVDPVYVATVTKPKSYSFTYISDLPIDHKAVSYIQDRNIPKDKWGDIGYTDDISVLAEEFDSCYTGTFFKEERIVIVIRNKDGICGFQCRSMKKDIKAGLKYFTLKKEEQLCYYGVGSVDTEIPYYILEGPINSMFLPNAIATLGSSNFLNVSDKMSDTNGIYVLDNEPYKRETLSIMDKLIKSGKKVCIFPENIAYKDINDMVSAGIDPLKLINENVYSGLKAKFIFNKWKKVLL